MNEFNTFTATHVIVCFKKIWETNKMVNTLLRKRSLV